MGFGEEVRMTKKYLFDTCIWRDYYENRLSTSQRPLGEYAAELFMKILVKKEVILFSEALLWELKKDYEEDEINDMLNLLVMNKVLIKIEITKEEYTEGGRLAEERNLPFVDCLFAVQARNHQATLITQDKHFFENLCDIKKPERPENIT